LIPFASRHVFPVHPIEGRGPGIANVPPAAIAPSPLPAAGWALLLPGKGPAVAFLLDPDLQAEWEAALPWLKGTAEKDALAKVLRASIWAPASAESPARPFLRRTPFLRIWGIPVYFLAFFYRLVSALKKASSHLCWVDVRERQSKCLIFVYSLLLFPGGDKFFSRFTPPRQECAYFPILLRRKKIFFFSSKKWQWADCLASKINIVYPHYASPLHHATDFLNLQHSS